MTNSDEIHSCLLTPRHCGLTFSDDGGAFPQYMSYVSESDSDLRRLDEENEVRNSLSHLKIVLIPPV